MRALSTGDVWVLLLVAMTLLAITGAISIADAGIRAILRARRIRAARRAYIAATARAVRLSVAGPIHACPRRGDGGVMPCCGRTPFELGIYDRLATDPALVTCRGLASTTRGATR